MPFGLKNTPATFQRTLNKVLNGLIGKVCFVYIDDIIIFSRDPVEHAKHLAMVFERLLEADLKIKRKKCYFALDKVDLLGYTISGNGIEPQAAKTDAISKLRQPQSVSELRSFLGMTNY